MLSCSNSKNCSVFLSGMIYSQKCFVVSVVRNIDYHHKHNRKQNINNNIKQNIKLNINSKPFLCALPQKFFSSLSLIPSSILETHITRADNSARVVRRRQPATEGSRHVR